MKFAKHLAKAMNVSDPEWFPYWINYKHLKKFLKLSLAWNRITEVTRASSSPTSKRPGGVIEGSPSMENREEHKKQLEKRQDGQQAKVSGKERPWKRLRERYGNTEPAAPPKIVRSSLTSDVSGHRSNGVANTKSGFPAKTSPLPRPNASIGASSSADGNVRRAKLSVPCAGTPHEGDEDECPFFGALLREVDKCSTFFLENEEDLKVRVQRLQLALHKLKDPVLSRLSSVKDCHVKLMQVHHVRPYLMGHGQIGKGWEQVASDLSTLRPFAAAGGIKADSCQQKYVSMRKEHREKVAKGDWVSGRRDGESEVVHSFLDACMCEEQAMQEIRNIKRDDSAEREEEQEEEKEARAEKLLEASLAPAGSRFRICGEYESRESSGKKRTTSSSSSYPSMEGIMAGYLASMSSSPDTKRRRKEIEASDAAARQQQTENRREEIAVRRLEVELRQSRAEGDPRNPKANPRISRETYG